MTVSSLNITGALASDVFSEKPLLPPLTEMLVMRHYPQEKKKHHSQKIHMMRWFRYTGKMEPNTSRSAESIYNHLQCVEGLVWIAEVMGIPEQKIIDACEMAYQTNDRKSAQCARFRAVIPWQAVEPAIKRDAAALIVWRESLWKSHSPSRLKARHRRRRLGRG